MIPALWLSELVETRAAIPVSGADEDDARRRTVTASDRARLLEIARIQLQSQAYDRMRANLTKSQVIIIESLQIEEEDKDWLDYSAEVGAEAGELSLSMRAEVSAFAIDEADARQLAETRLLAEAPDGMALLPDSLRFQRGAFSLSRAKQQVRFDARASADLQAQLDIDRAERAVGWREPGRGLRDSGSAAGHRPAASAGDKSLSARIWIYASPAPAHPYRDSKRDMTGRCWA